MRRYYTEGCPPEIDFNVLISQTLSKSVTVMTSCYDTEEDEDGCICYITDDTDWNEEYRAEHYTPLGLIRLFKEHLQYELDDNPDSSREHIARIKYLIKECSDWTEDETEIVRD